MPDFHSLAHGELITLLAEEQKPIIIDDFHYIPPAVQTSLCRQIKNAAGRGIRFVILNTPHRGDDPIRNNNDLSGRFFSVDLGFWDVPDLKRIGEKGFAKIGITFEDEVLSLLANEALRSPQLMQTLCLETCRSLSQDMPYREQHIGAGTFNLSSVKERAVRSYNMKTQLHFLQSGPVERGRERNVYNYSSGGRGDVYDVLVRILTADPPFVQLSLDEMKHRVRNLVVGGSADPNIRAALNQVQALFKDGHPPNGLRENAPLNS